jgi:dTDP-4-amino-4,6-dideoxygalactose transaminase
MDIIQTANPRASYLALKAEIDAALQSVLNGTDYILGPVVEGFERSFAAYTGVGHGVGVNNGTDAIHLALRGLAIGAGDEVITVSHTAVATVAAIEMSGATPVLVDIEPQWLTIDPAQVERAIGPRTRAVIAVHLYGQPADLGALDTLCRDRGVALVEDAAQAHGARWGERMVGCVGEVATFSFYPTKNLGAVGDGGMIVTDNAELAARLRLLRQYGWATPQHSLLPGWNTRLDPLQAAVLQVKLKYLESQIERRRALAARYNEHLASLPLKLPEDRPECRHAYHLYVVRTADGPTRDGLQRHLNGLGVMPGIHYPNGVHVQPGYAGRITSGPMPVTESVTPVILSLPLYPELTQPNQDRVIAAVRSYFQGPR